MKIVKKIMFIGDEKAAIKECINGKKSLRDTAKVLGCSHEQVRTLIGRIFLQGVSEGWITVDFNEI